MNGEIKAMDEFNQRNIITGLIEAEYINDNHIFEAGHRRPPQTKNTIRKFRDTLDMIEKRVTSNQKTLYDTWQ